jgi:hypothetical protein
MMARLLILLLCADVSFSSSIFRFSIFRLIPSSIRKEPQGDGGTNSLISSISQSNSSLVTKETPTTKPTLQRSDDRVEEVHLEWPELIVFADEALRWDPAAPQMERLIDLLRARTGLDVAVCNVDRDVEARRAWEAVHLVHPHIPRYVPLGYNRRTGEVKALPCSLADLMGWALGRPGADDRTDPSSAARIYGQQRGRSTGSQGSEELTDSSGGETGHPVYLHMLGEHAQIVNLLIFP